MEEWDTDRSKFGVFVSELEGDSGEDTMEGPTIVEVARTEEGGSQSPIGENLPLEIIVWVRRVSVTDVR